MPQQLRAYEMVEETSPEEIGLMKQQARIEAAQRLRRDRQATNASDAGRAGKEGARPQA